MLAVGIMEESTPAHTSPVVMVEKPDGTKRVCVDYRKLNCVTVFDPEPMPTAEEIFAKLSEDRFSRNLTSVKDIGKSQCVNKIGTSPRSSVTKDFSDLALCLSA